MAIKSISELERVLTDKITNAMNSGINKEVEQVLKDSITKNVYNAYSPTAGGYSRSHRLLNSVTLFPTKKVGSAVTALLGHDETKLQGYSSVAGGSYNVSPFIPNIVSDGTAGGIYQQGYWRNSNRYDSSHTFAQPRPYIEDAYNELAGGKLANVLRSALRDQGLKVK